MLFLGITILIINTISLICILATPKESSLSFINNFWDYFNNNSTGIIISDFIINLILQFTYSILLILTIYFLGTKFILISHASSKYFFILANEYNSMKYICIIFDIDIVELLCWKELIEIGIFEFDSIIILLII